MNKLIEPLNIFDYPVHMEVDNQGKLIRTEGAKLQEIIQKLNEVISVLNIKK